MLGDENERAGTTRSVARAVARHYPIVPFRARLPWLNGTVAEIPHGEIVETREGLVVRVMPDGMYRNIYYWGDYEPYNTKVYRRIVREGDVVFDVGANFGWFTTLFARWVGAAGRVHSFEPVPFIHALAAETIALNGLGSRVELNDFGLGEADAALTIFTYEGLPHGHATAVDLGRRDAVAHECRIRRLDDYCAEQGIRSFRFMKVDVEGFEREVFLGGERVLSAKDAPIIAFEINRECLLNRSLQSVDVIAALRALGYTDFFSFSTRTGIRRLETDAVEGTVDCLATKPQQLDELRPALRTGRLFR
jgi:FkbM family methyltransferase